MQTVKRSNSPLPLLSSVKVSSPILTALRLEQSNCMSHTYAHHLCDKPIGREELNVFEKITKVLSEVCLSNHGNHGIGIPRCRSVNSWYWSWY